MNFPNYVHQNNHHSNQVIDHFLPPAKSHLPPHSQPSTPEAISALVSLTIDSSACSWNTYKWNHALRVWLLLLSMLWRSSTQVHAGAVHSLPWGVSNCLSVSQFAHFPGDGLLGCFYLDLLWTKLLERCLYNCLGTHVFTSPGIASSYVSIYNMIS